MPSLWPFFHILSVPPWDPAGRPMRKLQLVGRSWPWRKGVYGDPFVKPGALQALHLALAAVSGGPTPRTPTPLSHTLTALSPSGRLAHVALYGHSPLRLLSLLAIIHWAPNTVRFIAEPYFLLIWKVQVCFCCTHCSYIPCGASICSARKQVISHPSAFSADR